MHYPFYEGALQLPDGGEDESVNIIKFPARQAALVLTRARLQPGESLEGYYAQQMAQIKRTMKNFHLEEKTPVEITSPATTRQAYQTQCRFEQQGNTQHQCLLFTEAQGQVLVMAYSQPRALTEDDLTHWQAILSSLVLH